MAAIDDALRSALRPSAAALEPYDPAFAPVRINLSANENGLGLPPGVAAELGQALARTATNRYPRPLSDELRQEIALWHGVAPERVCVGNGGDELLFNLFVAFGGAGRTLVDCPPSFSVYRLYAELAETEVVDVPRDPADFSLDEAALVDAARGASVVVVTSPNNPTGNLARPGLVRELCGACPGLVLADEAYMEFADAGQSSEPLLGEFDNLVVLHTFSKAFALAGARVGYALASPGVVAALNAVRQPYSVNVLSQAATLVCVRRRDEFAPSVELIRRERARVLDGLRRLAGRGVEVWPSQGNFLLLRVPDAHGLWERLKDERSILVRDFSRAPGLAGCLRVTVGTPKENDAFLQAMGELLP